jgi:hypothetical protein
MTCDLENPGSGLGLTYKCGGVNPVNGNPAPFLIIGSPTTMQIQVNI